MFSVSRKIFFHGTMTASRTEGPIPEKCPFRRSQWVVKDRNDGKSLAQEVYYTANGAPEVIPRNRCKDARGLLQALGLSITDGAPPSILIPATPNNLLGVAWSSFCRASRCR